MLSLATEPPESEGGEHVYNLQTGSVSGSVSEHEHEHKCEHRTARSDATEFRRAHLTVPRLLQKVLHASHMNLQENSNHYLNTLSSKALKGVSTRGPARREWSVR